MRARIAVKMCVVGEEIDDENDLGVPGDWATGGVAGAWRRAGCTSREGDATLGGRGDPAVGVDGRSDGCVISKESDVLGRTLMPVDRSKLALGDFGLFAWIGEVERARGASAGACAGTGGSGRLIGGSGWRANLEMSSARFEISFVVRTVVGTLGKAWSSVRSS